MNQYDDPEDNALMEDEEDDRLTPSERKFMEFMEKFRSPKKPLVAKTAIIRIGGKS